MRNWLIALCALLFSSSVLALTPWQKMKEPVKATPQSIGGFSNGCVIGAKALPLKHSGYQVMRSNQLRYFGHPDLVKFIQRLANQVEKENLGVMLVGDMGMPAGGRFTYGHASHQTGLDVDIWLQLPDVRWSTKQLLNPKPIDLVAANNKEVVDTLWQPEIGDLIKLAAKDSTVTRIFVHPAIKQQLCNATGSDRQWLNKVRPWFGHRAHMHVRLRCPPKSFECLEQAPPPKGDGCGKELKSWFDAPPKTSTKSKVTTLPLPPDSCQALIDNNFKVKR